MAHVLYSSYDTAALLGLREAVHALLLNERLLDHFPLRLHLLQSLLGRLRAPSLPPPTEAIDHIRRGGQLLLLALPFGHLLRDPRVLLAHEVRVVPFPRLGDAALRLHNLRAQLVQEGAVVAHDHHRHLLAFEIRLEPLHRVQVEVIGGLVEEEQVGLLEEDLAQRHTHLPPAREGGHEAVVVVLREPERAHHAVDRLVHAVHVRVVRLLLQLVELVQQLLHAVHVLEAAPDGRLSLLHLLLDLLLLRVHRHELLPHRALHNHLKLLCEICYFRPRRHDNIAGVRLHLANNDLQLRRLAASVVAHQPHPLPLFALPAHVFQDFHVFERL
mmetsp:Transcript_19261/g.32377  ORF Transcript_19261/g.32377 Transcript_19261/m.32377 type:complete len:329 (-) Transcript_19261:482-1468(-)